MMQLNIHIKPGASRNQVETLWFEDGAWHLKVRVTAVPEKGAANKAMIKLLSKHFKLAQSHIHLVRGDLCRRKVVELPIMEDQLNDMV